MIGAASEAALPSVCAPSRRPPQRATRPPPAPPAAADLRAPERLAIDYADAAELAEKAAKALKAWPPNSRPCGRRCAPRVFSAARPGAQGRIPLYRARARSTSTCCRALRDAEPIVAETFAEADRVMTPLLGKPLSEFIFVDRPTPKPWPRPKTICARPRSRNRPCLRSISR